MAVPMPMRLFFASALLFGFGCGGTVAHESPPSVIRGETPGVPSGPEVDIPHRYETFRDVALYVGETDGLLRDSLLGAGELYYPNDTSQGGSVRGYAAGSFFYTPPVGFVGIDSFRYSFVSGEVSLEGTVEVTVRDGVSGLSVDLYGGEHRFAVVPPTDPQEFASFVQAQIAGGALEGRTTIYQADGIPFTRFATVIEAPQYHATVGRNYACQLAAQSLGYDPLDSSDIARAAREFEQMHPEAQLFLQVAAVFKGKLLDGPGEYDNPGLRQLLVSKGLSHFIPDGRVGDRDIPTLGAVGAAMNAGQLTMADILNSGTFEDVERYDQVVEYVYDGRFQDLVSLYESFPIPGQP